MKRKLTAFLLCLALALLSGCREGAPAAADTGGEDTQPSAQATAFQTSLSELDLEFTARDLDVGYEETTAAQASLLGDSIQVSGTGAQAEGSTLKITEDGEYVQVVDGMHDTIEVKITVEGGQITGIAIGEGRDEMLITDEQLAQYVDSIISTQSTGVDIISGATTDCQAIVTAIVRAFAG